MVSYKMLPILSALEKIAGRNGINPIFVKNLLGPVIANWSSSLGNWFYEEERKREKQEIILSLHIIDTIELLFSIKGVWDT